MANKFSSLIFTEEGKDVMTKALADKGQMSIIDAYTFTVSLTKDLTYSQISGLNPKQTKPMGTVTTDLTTNTVESRLIIDNRDVTADYNLKGIAITGVYGTDNYVLGIINTNETTLVPAYNGQSAQTINLDVSFAISDTSIVTVNTQYAGMLTVADYIALQKYIDQRDAKKADDTAAVHKTGNETINDIKTFLKTIVGSVSGNSGTSDRVNTLAINADVALSSLSNGVYLSTNASKTTSDKPTGAAETYVFVKESNVERFTDISNGQSYFRVKNGSTYTAWNRFSTAAELSNVDASAVHKTGNETIGGSKTFSSAIIANLQGNADTATKLKTARTISFSGAATGTGTFDGSGNVDIALTESAITRTNTSSSQSLAVGGTVTIIDSITTNTSGEITGVNVKTATMPSVYPPNNDSNLVHKSGAETIGGSKTFTDGLSGALAGNATSATKLATARKINGENFDGTADINIDPVVQVISTNKDVFTLDNGFYYYANIGATNKPSGSSNYFVVEVIQSTNNGFMQLVDSNNNAWWTTKSGGAWSAWKAVANDALVAHLDTAETFTGKKTFSAGLAGELTGNAATATTLKTARKVGGVSFDGSADINLPGVNTAGNQNTSGNAATATQWATTRTLALTGDVSGSVNIDGSGDVSMATSGTNLVHKTGDTMTGNLTAPQVIATDLLTGFHNVIQVPTNITKIIDLINNEFIKGRGFWKEATYIAYNTQLSDAPTNDMYSIIKLATRGSNRTYVEYSDLSGNVWHTTATTNTLLPWVKQADDASVVHNTGNETIAGDKTFTNPINGQLAIEPENLFFNSEFENSGEGWQIIAGGGSFSISPGTNNVSGHTFVTLKLTAGYMKFGNSRLYPATGNVNYSLSSLVNAGNVSGVYFIVDEFDGNKTQIKSTPYLLTNSASWGLKTASFVTQAQTQFLRVTYQVGGQAGQVAYVSAPMWNAGTTPLPYVRGSEMQAIPDDNNIVHKSGDTMTGGLKGGQVNLPASGDLNTLTDTGKYYQTTSVNAVNWSNRPSNAPNLAFSVDVIGQANRSLATQVFYVHTTSRMWVRTLWLNGTDITTSQWTELANDANVVHNTGNETIAGDKTFTGNLNVSGTLSSTDTYLRVGKPILSPIISSSVVMWYGWKVYYYVHNGVVTYQIQTNSSTIPAGTKSNEKLPAAARPIYKTFVPLAYGGQGFAINIDGTFENYTGAEISGASWASATSHVLNL
ncbi:hypothetical protein HAU38_05575 [Weissella confusa]|uniref:pyocin knob domain-containing protein n=1 Tax=Weissella confusa TaxID=1583 RepID=UPI0018F13FAC|nr:pyocin knob domain-containing protein [Weissella confusa]MBJ7675619.1 hypothetical protein [Weissella confusa]